MTFGTRKYSGKSQVFSYDKVVVKASMASATGFGKYSSMELASGTERTKAIHSVGPYIMSSVADKSRSSM